MNSSFQPLDDSPAVRARIPADVASGQLSTGVIVVTGATEYVLDFVRSLPRPSVIVARVVMPHAVMPQFIQALDKNIELYRQRFGPLPGQPNTSPSSTAPPNTPAIFTGNLPLTTPEQHEAIAGTSGQGNSPMKAASPPPATNSPIREDLGTPIDVHSGVPLEPLPTPNKSTGSDDTSKSGEGSGASGTGSGNVTRHPNPQEVYDELKMKDELLSGAYANAVMIGHGQYEYSFDFITNFYPQSAVSSRVFMSAGHVWRLLESLKTSWEQLRPRFGGGPAQ